MAGADEVFEARERPAKDRCGGRKASDRKSRAHVREARDWAAATVAEIEAEAAITARVGRLGDDNLLTRIQTLQVDPELAEAFH